MRRLNKEEARRTQIGINTREKQMQDSIDTIEFSKVTEKFLRAKREYEDFTRPKTQKAQHEELKKTVEQAEQNITECKEIIKELKRQIKEGVNEKEIKGI